MEKFAILRFAALAAVVVSIPVLAAPDFEPEILARVKGGEVVVENLVTSNSEFRVRIRAFFPGATPDGFVKLVTNHGNMPNWIPEVKKAETLAEEEENTVFRYKAEVFIDLGILNQTLYPEGTQRITRTGIPGDDLLIRNTITNYIDQIQGAEERTKLSPYDGGFLLDSTIEAVGRKDLPAFISGLIRKELRTRGKRLVERSRTALARN